MIIRYIHFFQLFILFIGFLGTQVGVAGESSTKNVDVQVSVALADSTISFGKTGIILVTFTPADDIHVNAVPPVEFSLRSARAFRLSSKPTQIADKESGYLLTRSPVAQPFRLSKSVPPGVYRMAGTVVYFYCSDIEGWCRKHVEPVECFVKVVP